MSHEVLINSYIEKPQQQYGYLPQITAKCIYTFSTPSTRLLEKDYLKNELYYNDRSRCSSLIRRMCLFNFQSKKNSVENFEHQNNVKKIR